VQPFLSNSIQTPSINERILLQIEPSISSKKRNHAHITVIIATATALAATVPVSTATAQGVTVEGPAGVGVRVGEQDRYRERRGEGRREGRRDERREGRHYRDRTTVGDGCRTVVSKSRAPDGTVVIRRKSSC
jgi:hypothetical protein